MQIPKLYNSNGNWYILEGLDYFWFGRNIFTRKENEFLFSDSLHLCYNGKPDKEKYKMLRERAEEDINFFWDSLYNLFKKSGETMGS